MSIIKFENVHFTYPGDQMESLCGIDLEIEAGSFVAVLGHNGSGKSTLAKHMNGILVPNEGRVLVKDIDSSDESRLIELRRNVGMVFQNPDNQIVANVVEDDVAFAPENLGVEPKEIRRRVDEALKLVDMYDKRRHAPHLLSGGQKQRVAIAGVIAMEPEIIVLDEPTAGLDPAGCRQILENICSYREKTGATVIIVSHNMDDVARIAERIIVFSHGRIVMDGTAKEVFSRAEELVEIGLDVPHATELALALKKQGLPMPEGIYTHEQLLQAVLELKGVAAC